MNSFIIKFKLLIIIISGLLLTNAYGQENTTASISGKLYIDSSWSTKVYLSHIKSFDEMYLMSSKMIIAETNIDSLGFFSFQLDYLPKGDHLYRLHIVKKEDSQATLIIGGKDENHSFLILNPSSNIIFTSLLAQAPFRNVVYKNSLENSAFQQISKLVFKADSISSESSASKRTLVESKLCQDLKLIADTSNNFLVSQYAFHKNHLLSGYSGNEEFYTAYYSKWKNQNSAYFKKFANKIPLENKRENPIVLFLIVAFSIVALFFLFKTKMFKSNRIKMLSVQERKIFELLKQGASNQEISSELNIGLSTVKSHASSIYTKLKVKSRKDIINM